MTLIEAAKQARNMLEHIDLQDADRDFLTTGECEELDRIIAVINQAIAEAEQQEPVVWMYVNRSTHETVFQKHMRSFINHSQWKEVSLYGEPLANHELQCVCGAVWCGDEMVHLPDKRPPASKPWVGLTQQDIDIAFDDTQEGGGFNEFARAIEAKLRELNEHREKNNGTR